MKHFAKLFSIVVMVGICSAAVAQQNYKFGHINAQELIMLMPERDSATVKLENYGKELQDQLEALQVEYNTKLNAYQQKQATWSAAILEAKQKELMDINTRIQEQQPIYQADFQQMQQTLLRPVIEKANKAIETVAKREGFTYIFDISTGSLPYFNPEQSIDLLPLVKKELNITKDTPTARPAAATGTR